MATLPLDSLSRSTPLSGSGPTGDSHLQDFLQVPPWGPTTDPSVLPVTRCQSRDRRYVVTARETGLVGRGTRWTDVTGEGGPELDLPWRWNLGGTRHVGGTVGVTVTGQWRSRHHHPDGGRAETTQGSCVSRGIRTDNGLVCVDSKSGSTWVVGSAGKPLRAVSRVECTEKLPGGVSPLAVSGRKVYVHSWPDKG